MDIEICKSDAGYHVKDKDSDTEKCFETLSALMVELSKYMPKHAGKECCLTNGD